MNQAESKASRKKFTEALDQARKRFPDQRIGQIIFNGLEAYQLPPKNDPIVFREKFHQLIFYVSDDALAEILTLYSEK